MATKKPRLAMTGIVNWRSSEKTTKTKATADEAPWSINALCTSDGDSINKNMTKSLCVTVTATVALINE